MWATRRRNILLLFLKPQQINVNEMLNPVKCLAVSIIFITLSNVKQNKKRYGKYKYNINCSINALHGREN